MSSTVYLLPCELYLRKRIYEYKYKRNHDVNVKFYRQDIISAASGLDVSAVPAFDAPTIMSL